jgi:hypothetical protein
VGRHKKDGSPPTKGHEPKKKNPPRTGRPFLEAQPPPPFLHTYQSDSIYTKLTRGNLFATIKNKNTTSTTTWIPEFLSFKPCFFTVNSTCVDRHVVIFRDIFHSDCERIHDVFGWVVLTTLQKRHRTLPLSIDRRQHPWQWNP